MNSSRGEVSPDWVVVLLFSKLFKRKIGFFDPEIEKIIKINNFRGELTDISAEK